MTNIELFIFTVKEYLRFAEFFDVKDTHALTDGRTEQEYVAIHSKLMLLRKYGSNKENVNLKTILDKVMEDFPQERDACCKLKDVFDSVQKKTYDTFLSDGTNKEFYEIVEDVIYGIYLHADEPKIKDLMRIDSTLRFSLIREYVEGLEAVLFSTYNLVKEYYQDVPELHEFQRAPVVSLSNECESKQSITGSEYWSNLKGYDLTDEMINESMTSRNPQDILLVGFVMFFLEELKKDELNTEALDSFVFPPTKSDWGDYSVISTLVKDAKDIGYSTYVEYNDSHDMAYIKIFQHIQGGFVIEGQHLIGGDVATVTMVYEKRFGWRIYSIGSKQESFKESLGLVDSVKRIFGSVWNGMV